VVNDCACTQWNRCERGLRRYTLGQRQQPTSARAGLVDCKVRGRDEMFGNAPEPPDSKVATRPLETKRGTRPYFCAPQVVDGRPCAPSRHLAERACEDLRIHSRRLSKGAGGYQRAKDDDYSSGGVHRGVCGSGDFCAFGGRYGGYATSHAAGFANCGSAAWRRWRGPITRS
jgi:hypothetical protein